MTNTTEIRQEYRLQYIDLCAYVLGSINRSKLMNRFEIMQAWSTRDFKKYQEIAPHNLAYDHRLKAYTPTTWFSPYFEHKIQDAIDLICNGSQRITCEPKFANHQNNYAIPSVLPELKNVAPIFRALNLATKVDIEYLSRSSGKSKRTIAPHTLIKTGNFVYIRAFDHKSGDFRSFKLNRVVASHDSEITVEETQTQSSDAEWNNVIEVIIGLNGTPKNPETIAFDYGLETETGQLAINIKRALLPYFLADWNIAPVEYPDLPNTLFPLKVIKVRDI